MFVCDINAIKRCTYVYLHKHCPDLDLSGCDYNIITFLACNDGVNQDTIAKQLMLDKGGVAKSLAALEKKGYLIRCINEENRREKLIYFTDEGKLLVECIDKVMEEWTQQVLQDLPEEEKTCYIEVLRDIAKKAKEIVATNDVCNGNCH